MWESPKIFWVPLLVLLGLFKLLTIFLLLLFSLALTVQVLLALMKNTQLDWVYLFYLDIANGSYVVFLGQYICSWWTAFLGHRNTTGVYLLHWVVRHLWFILSGQYTCGMKITDSVDRIFDIYRYGFIDSGLDNSCLFQMHACILTELMEYVFLDIDMGSYSLAWTVHVPHPPSRHIYLVPVPTSLRRKLFRLELVLCLSLLTADYKWKIQIILKTCTDTIGVYECCCIFN